ncbi:MAG: hypothetical protein Q8P89_04660 [bacterium]|nr:hypothetical protein [bacterium]
MPKSENDQNLQGALAYLLGFLTGIYFLLTAKNDFVRFHAKQSTVIFGGLFVLNFIPVINFFTLPIGFILWIFLMYKAYSGERYKLPYVGELLGDEGKKG